MVNNTTTGAQQSETWRVPAFFLLLPRELREIWLGKRWLRPMSTQ